MTRQEQLACAKGALILIAKQGATVPYIDMEDVIGANRTSPIMNQVLTELMDKDFAEGRPFLSSLVVKKDSGMPGKGFFTVVENITGKKFQSDLERFQYWTQEKNACIDLWRSA